MDKPGWLPFARRLPHRFYRSKPKYSEGTIPKTPGQLCDAVVFMSAYAADLKFPRWTGLNFEGAFHRLFQGVENLRKRFGDSKSDQLLDMLRQAKTHFEAGEDFLGARLTQDIEEVIFDRLPFAYPKDRYRWPIDPNARPVVPMDLLRKRKDK